MIDRDECTFIWLITGVHSNMHIITGFTDDPKICRLLLFRAWLTTHVDDERLTITIMTNPTYLLLVYFSLARRCRPVPNLLLLLVLLRLNSPAGGGREVGG